MRLSNNISALQTCFRLSQANKKLTASNSRLSSGVKISSSKDDSAGLAISNKLDNQIRGMGMANRNSLDGVSMIQTADGALSEVQNILQRMRELAVSSANDTLETEDREKIQFEIDDLKKEINSISNKTEFNGIKLLETVQDSNGNDPIIKIHTGQNKSMNMDITLFKVTSKTLNLDGMSYLSAEDSKKSLKICDDALSKISEIRSQYGAFQNRLETTSRNLDSFEENAQKSLSRILDTDMAREMTLYTQNNIISQAATSILAQANQRPQQILQLLG